MSGTENFLFPLSSVIFSDPVITSVWMLGFQFSSKKGHLPYTVGTTIKICRQSSLAHVCGKQVSALMRREGLNEKDPLTPPTPKKEPSVCTVLILCSNKKKMYCTIRK